MTGEEAYWAGLGPEEEDEPMRQKFLMPGKDQVILCRKCREPIDYDLAHSEDGALDFPWCTACRDFQTGVTATLKICTSCKAPKLESEFYKRKGKAIAACIPCSRAKIEEWRARPENKESIRVSNRKHNKKNWRKHRYARYGLTLEQYESMLEAQKGVCAICKNPDTRRLSVDHCHITGKVRGLLCTKCNHGLGDFGDSTTILSAAANYLIATPLVNAVVKPFQLERHPKKRTDFTTGIVEDKK